MFRSRIAISTLLAATLAFSCVSFEPASSPRETPSPRSNEVSPEPTTPSPSPDSAPATPKANAGQAQTGDDFAAMKELYKEGLDALDNSQTVEAIKSFISVLAEFEMLSRPSAEAVKFRDQANLQLTKIGTGLFIEPGPEWVDSGSGKQISGSTRTLGKQGALNPSVILYENFGAGRVYVRGAGIAFEFAKNSGTLTPLVSTNDEGKANSVVAKIDSAGKETIVRAYPYFRVKGHTYAFKNIAREFTWLPPSNACIVISLEKSEAGATNNAQTADAIGASLKKIGFDVRPVNAVAAQGKYMEAYSGSMESVRALAGEGISYVALAFLDCYQVNQVVYNGQAFNLYSAFVKPTLRIIREDGTILHTVMIDQVKADGGSKEAAIDKAYQAARARLVADIEKSRSAILAALDGK